MSASNQNSNVDTMLRENAFKQRGGTIHSATSERGTYTYYYDEKIPCIWLQWVKSYSPGNGFGTEVMREMIKLSNEKKCPGDIRLDASYSSHLFYLFLGMIPEDKPCRYTHVKYGPIAAEALLELSKIKDEDDIQFYIDDNKKYVIDKLKQVLRDEKTLLQELKYLIKSC